MFEHPKKAYIVAADMGYGHARAAYALVHMATTPSDWNIQEPTIILANNYPGMPRHDSRRWAETRKLYESVSRVSGFPFFGKRIFHAMDYFEKIEPLYPRPSFVKPTFLTKEAYRMIKKGLGKNLIDLFNKNPLPLIASYPIPAFCAEEHGYKGDIYCLCTDTDISRAIAPLHPEKSRIIYLAPTQRAKDRLMLYGVREEKIIVTGFPLPTETLGDKTTLSSIRSSLACRIMKLDPHGVYQKKYKQVLSMFLGDEYMNVLNTRPLTITYSIGGAGAQSDVGIKILHSLAEHIKQGKVKLNLVPGTSEKLLHKFTKAIEKAGLQGHYRTGVNVIYNPNKFEYFKEFNRILPETDILWTKPSELSFYVGLGLPIIMTEPLGSQEEYNKVWLHMIGAGFEQYNPKYTHEWLFDWLKEGWLAQAAVNGFLNAPKRAAYHIEDIVLHKKEINETN